MTSPIGPGPGDIMANQALAALGEQSLAIQTDTLAIPNPILGHEPSLVDRLSGLAPAFDAAAATAALAATDAGHAISGLAAEAGSVVEQLGTTVGQTAGNIIGGVLHWKLILIIVAILIAAVFIAPSVAPALMAGKTKA